jgi:DHA1 family bicyclomycin/chloramphenicol resistance-like MFS transporter
MSSSRALPPIALLVMISAISPLALNIFVPSMPGLARDLDASEAAVQLTLTLYLTSIAVSQLAIGPLSDRFGRRPVLIIGIGLFILATLACRFAPSLEWLIVARALQGMGGCTGIVLGRAIVRDVFDRDKAASMIGYVTMGMAVAPMIGPAIGGFLDELYGWRASFDLLILLGVVIWTGVLFRLDETNPYLGKPFHFQSFIADHKALAGSACFWSYAFTSAFATGVFFAFLGGAPFVTTQLMGLSPSSYGLYFMLVAGGYLIGNFISGQKAQMFGPNRMILLGNSISLFAVFCMISFTLTGFFHPLMLFGPMFFLGISNGMTLPSAIANAVSIRPDLAGAAAGISGFLQIGIGAFATALMGILPSTTLWPLLVVMAFMSISAFTSGRIAERLATNAMHSNVMQSRQPRL